ncbi:hypothetical protein quinque_007581 [Culex quinquefasciatus]
MKAKQERVPAIIPDECKLQFSFSAKYKSEVSDRVIKYVPPILSTKIKKFKKEEEPTDSFGVAVAAAIFLWNTNNLFLWGVVLELIYWISRLATRGHFIEHLQHVAPETGPAGRGLIAKPPQ